MSNLNIKRVVENIRSHSSPYTPVIEVIVNAIQAIELKENIDGKITIKVERAPQNDLDGSLGEIESISIEDNGVGFTDGNRESFDTLYSDLKLKDGGKGFGRFTCLKYFDTLQIKSIYESDQGVFKKRSFEMGNENEIIINEKIEETNDTDSKSTIYLKNIKKNKKLDKKLQTIARILVEKLLPYFITDDYKCPEIILSEVMGTNHIVLNDFISKSSEIQEIPITQKEFELPSTSVNRKFSARLFKVMYPGNQKSKISLVAHKREVTSTNIQKYIPEFSDDFYEKIDNSESTQGKNYIIKTYVFGDYLDENVSLERGSFEFQVETDILLGISQSQIEKKAAEISKSAVGEDIKARQEKKKERVQQYVDDSAPWHKELINEIDLSDMPFNPTNEDIETQLQKEKFKKEREIKIQVAEILNNSDLDNLKENINDLVAKISATGKNDLIHYIAMRRNILDLFKKNLEIKDDQSYQSEGAVHDIIFPRKGDSDLTPFQEHNLWLIDERLNFTKYISSDLPLDKGNSERPDLLAYARSVLYRGDNLASNPITIFEFKKPGRHDFVNPSSNEDPVQQIVRYVNNIKDGKFKTPEGREMRVETNTPFYGYVICDINQKVELWLEREKNFKPMPDKMGWFHWMDNINLYIEVLSWDKILEDAEMRNRIFFEKLGI
jgi:hypothetical protein